MSDSPGAFITEAEAKELRSFELVRRLEPLVNSVNPPQWALEKYSTQISQNINVLVNVMGNPEEARLQAPRAIAAAQRIGHIYNEAKARKFLAMALFYLNDYRESLDENRRALVLYEQVEIEARSLGIQSKISKAAKDTDKERWGLVQNLVKLRRLDEAEAEFTRCRQDGSRQIEDIAARIALARRRFDDALRHLANSDAVDPTPHGQQSITLLRSMALLALGRFPEAEATARAAQKITEELKRAQFEPHFFLGQAVEAQGRSDEALSAYRLAIDSLALVQSRQEDLLEHYLENKGEVFDRTIALLLTSDRPEEALTVSIESQNRILRQALAGDALLWRHVPKDIQKKEADLRHKIFQLRQNPKTGNGDNDLATLMSERDRMTREAFDRLPAVIAVANARIDLEAIRAGLEPDETLAVIHPLPDRYAWWLLRRNCLRSGIIRMEGATAKLPASIIRLMTDSRQEKMFDLCLKQVASPILAPFIQEILADHPGRIAIAPHPALWDFPFHALSTQSGEMLAAHVPLHYLPSPTMLCRPKQPVKTGILVVGDPQRNLPHAGIEAESVAKLLGGSALLRNSATRAAVTAALPFAGVAHFACHCTWNEEHPDLCGLVLADGVLAMHDLMAEDLSGLRLLSLLGCRTGSVARSGAEMRGLTTAALAAGCGAVLVASIPISDAISREFAKVFFGEIRRGASPAGACVVGVSAIEKYPEAKSFIAAVRVVG